MKTFEEQFPELAKEAYDEHGVLYPASEISKHCLSKQRVRELIEDWKSHLGGAYYPPHAKILCGVLDRLKEDLGL